MRQLAFFVQPSERQLLRELGRTDGTLKRPEVIDHRWANVAMRCFGLKAVGHGAFAAYQRGKNGSLKASYQTGGHCLMAASVANLKFTNDY
jgi:hypothetical protein